MLRFRTICLLSLLLFCFHGGIASPADPPSSALAFRFENDLFGSSDRFYTNGFSLAYARPGQPGGPVGYLWNLMRAPKWFSGRLSHTYEFGQIITTPEDTTLVIPDPADRPYSGILFLASSLQFEQEATLDVVEMIIGVLGPAALGEETQNFVHRLVGTDQAQGWDSQLGNEPILNLVYERRHRVRLTHDPEGWGAELIGTGGAMLGNVLTQAQAGLQFRFGFRLPNDFGHSLIRGAGNVPPTCQCWGERDDDGHHLGFQVFAGMSGNLVARNITLDGNTFRDSPRVSKKPFFAGAECGAALVFRRMQLGYAYVVWGREFEGQQGSSKFGTIFFSVGF